MAINIGYITILVGHRSCMKTPSIDPHGIDCALIYGIIFVLSVCAHTEPPFVESVPWLCGVPFVQDVCMCDNVYRWDEA
jgi:hypothetical protein